MKLPPAPKRGDLVDLDAVFRRLLSPSPEKKTMGDPYRTNDRSETKACLTEAINNARILQETFARAVKNRNDNMVLDRDDVAMIAELNKSFAVACEHERELLKQLAEWEK